MKCILYPELEAEVYVKCGFYNEFNKGIPHHEYYLSKKASLELWERCKAIVGNGSYHWHNRELNESER